MTSSALDIKFCTFIRDVLEHPENLIYSGRCNKVQEDFETDYIVVDDLAASQRVSGNITCAVDPDTGAEVQNIANVYITTFTIDFYGENAYDNANRFVLLARSQQAYELKKSLGIGVYQVSSIQDLKKLAGQQFGNRWQVTLKVEDSRSVNVETLTIEKLNITTITD